MQILAYLDSEPLSVTLLAGCWTNWKTSHIAVGVPYTNQPLISQVDETQISLEQVVSKAITLLDELSLIHITERTITINTFVKSYITMYMRRQMVDLRQSARAALAMLMHSISWEDGLDDWTNSIRLYPHIHTILEILGEELEKIASSLCKTMQLEDGLDIASKVGAVYFQTGRHGDAEKIQHTTAVEARRALSIYHRITLRAMCELATTQMMLGRSKEALVTRQEVYYVRESIHRRQRS